MTQYFTVFRIYQNAHQIADVISRFLVVDINKFYTSAKIELYRP